MFKTVLKGLIIENLFLKQGVLIGVKIKISNLFSHIIFKLRKTSYLKIYLAKKLLQINLLLTNKA